jgi:CheY-like chemotaxis protein
MGDLSSAVVLLVEDDLGDQKLIKTSLRQQKIANRVQAVESGEQALKYLAAAKQSQAECPLPAIILLDLNMPGMGGKEFLRHVKADSDLATIPVVILTTSDAEEDILESYQLNAAGYVKKPVTLEGFQKVLAELEDYWFVLCKTARQKACACRNA